MSKTVGFEQDTVHNLGIGAMYIMQIVDNQRGLSHIVATPFLPVQWWAQVCNAAKAGAKDPLSVCIRGIGESNLTPRLLADVEDQFTAQAIGKFIRRHGDSLLQSGIGDKRADTFRVTHVQTGESNVITNLSRFCKERGLSKGTLSKTMTGERSHHRGWRLERNE